MTFRRSETLLDQIELSLRCFRTRLGLLLETVKHVDSIVEHGGVNRAERIAIVVSDDLYGVDTLHSFRR
jgi:hypothetical protein